jgi:hypothetical protein
MRSLVAAIAIIGCNDSDLELTAQEEYKALEARVDVDCGTYERNYSPFDPIPLHLCGEEPAIECVNGAIGGTAMTRMRYNYLDPVTYEVREQNYYAGDGKLVWIGYYEHEFREADWHRGDCSAVVAEGYVYKDMTCWTLKAINCVAR